MEPAERVAQDLLWLVMWKKAAHLASQAVGKLILSAKLIDR